MAGFYGYEDYYIDNVIQEFYNSMGSNNDLLYSPIYSPLFTRGALMVGVDGVYGTPTMPGMEFLNYSAIMSNICRVLKYRNETYFVDKGCSGDIYGFYDGFNWQDFNQYLQDQGYSFSAELHLDKEDVLDTKKYYKSPIVDRKNIA